MMGERPHKPIFVVQKHQARTLHYDFRLEIDGVLKSWAIPKGPSLNPAEKRLAIMVEDHDLSFGDFEGTIPEGDYGAGEIIIWDKGFWEYLPDKQRATAKEAIGNGKLRFLLYGMKLKGGWQLARLRRAKAEWILTKNADEHADDTIDIAKSSPSSVLSRQRS